MYYVFIILVLYVMRTIRRFKDKELIKLVTYKQFRYEYTCN